MKCCYICEGPVLKGEQDHFPIPKSLGGRQTMTICTNCHDLKDRHPLGKWDPSMAFSGLMGLWEKASRGERLVLVKMFHVLSQGHATMKFLKEQSKSERGLK